MGFGIKEAIALYTQSGLAGDMAVRVDESTDIIGVGRRNGKIVPIVSPGSTLTAAEIMKNAGIRESGRPTRGRVHIVGEMPLVVLPSRVKKTSSHLH